MHSLERAILEPQDRQRAGAVTSSLRTALLLCGSNSSSKNHELGELLDFFGIFWKAISMEEITAGVLPSDGTQYCVLGSATDLAEALQATVRLNAALPRWTVEAGSVYVWGFEDTDCCRNLLRFLTGDGNATIHQLNNLHAFTSITTALPEMCGPMSGLTVPVELTEGDLVFGVAAAQEGFKSVISTSNGQIFVRLLCQGTPFYLNACSRMVDINRVSEKHFDVKSHFLSAVPTTMYLKWAFHDVSWSSPETSACLIIDDPPLKPRYGFLRFHEMSELMDEHNFTTAIGFIPWNWRRTDPHIVDLFRSRPEIFSIAVHGCDHTASEFATRSAALLEKRVQTARQRMDSLVEITSLPYDRIMVFPQGVFSPETGRALKLNGFVAAVNTEVAPWQNDGNETKIRDLWDIAIMKYGTFPIFTRRYLSAGIENFAFDAILGKPCLIAAHHDVFKGHGRVLADFVEKVNALNWNLCWRPLGEALDHSFRFLSRGDETIIIRMFSESLVVENPTARPREVLFLKEESDLECVGAIMANQNPVDFNCDDGHLRFRIQLAPKETVRVRVTYFENQNITADFENGGVAYKVRTGLRRYLSEFRDNYVSQSDFLYKKASWIKQHLRG
jgi:hypothetical protein